MEKQKMGRQKPKLQLEELRVQSFITELKPELAQTAKGGVAAPPDDSTSEILSTVIVQSIKNSGDSKWPCRFACKTKGGGGGDTNSGPNSEP